MDNIKKLQRQAQKIYVVALIVMDAAVGLLAAMFIAFDTWEELLRDMRNDSRLTGSTLILAVMVIVCNFGIVWRLLVWHPSVKNLSPEIRAAINEQCMTGMICGNGILCEDGYLLVSDKALKVVLPEEFAKTEEMKAVFGEAKTVWVITHRHQQYMIYSLGRKLRGNGTFRPVDIDTFRQEIDRIISGESVR